jgi:hypothetical protein
MKTRKTKIHDFDKVKAKGVPELAYAMSIGKVSVSLAAKMAVHTPSVQQRFLEAVERGVKPSKAAREAVADTSEFDLQAGGPSLTVKEVAERYPEAVAQLLPQEQASLADHLEATSAENVGKVSDAADPVADLTEEGLAQLLPQDSSVLAQFKELVRRATPSDLHVMKREIEALITPQWKPGQGVIEHMADLALHDIQAVADQEVMRELSSTEQEAVGEAITSDDTGEPPLDEHEGDVVHEEIEDDDPLLAPKQPTQDEDDDLRALLEGL